MAGRRPGALRGRTQQADELAKWLRLITAGRTVRELEAEFHVSKSLWSEYRYGSSLPSAELITALVARYATPDVGELRGQEGRRLLRAAHEAAERLTAGQETALTPRPPTGDPRAEAVLRLDDARLRQIDAIERLAEARQHCERLEITVSTLQQECARLRRETSEAREEAP